MDDDPETASIRSSLSSYLVHTREVQKLAERILSCLALDEYLLAINFVGGKAIRTLNLKYRGKDKTTDVLSFPQLHFAPPVACRAVRAKRRTKRQGPAHPPRHLGDVIISVPDALANARSIGQSLDRELAFLLVHGILHLCGYDHQKKADERLMLKAQATLMSYLGLAPGRQGGLLKLVSAARPKKTRRMPVSARRRVLHA